MKPVRYFFLVLSLGLLMSPIAQAADFAPDCDPASVARFKNKCLCDPALNDFVKGECVKKCPPGHYRMGKDCVAYGAQVEIPQAPPVAVAAPVSQGTSSAPITCPNSQELVGNECKPKCGNHSERVNGECVEKCGNHHERVGHDCREKCGNGKERVGMNCMDVCPAKHKRSPSGECHYCPHG